MRSVHLDLLAAGRRAALGWLLVWVLVMLVAGTVVTGSVIAALGLSWSNLIAGPVVGVLLAVGLLTVGDWMARRWCALPRMPVVAAPELLDDAAMASIARGGPVPRVWRASSASPNVAAIRRGDRIDMYVTDALLDGLTRHEVEAVLAMQYALAESAVGRRMQRFVTAVGAFFPLVPGIALLMTVVAWLSGGDAGLAFAAFMVLFVAGMLLVSALQRKVLWAWGVICDAIAVETTRHPAPLGTALRRLAGFNGDTVPTWSMFGMADAYWAVRVRWSVTTTTKVNDRAVKRWSTEMVADLLLLIRARVVEEVLLRGREADAATRRAVEADFDAAAQAEASGAPDHVVDGISIGFKGASGGPGPVDGTWLAPPSGDR